MNRRNLLALLGSQAAVAKAAQAPTQACAVTGPPVYGSIPSVCAGDLEAYFTEEKLRSLVDMSKPLPRTKYEVVCYNYPCWHPCPWFEERFGKGWTQFQSLRDSKPMYPGELYPKYPLWGEYNEADPVWAEREIDTATEFGIDVWMHCWYWQEGMQRCQLQLQDGLLKARNRRKLKFAVMWANHDYWNAWPAPTNMGGKGAIIGRQRHTEEDSLRVIDYCIEHYFREPNYWRLTGGPVFGIYSINNLLRDIPMARLRPLFDRMRERVAKAGLGNLHFQANSFQVADAGAIKDLGIQTATNYGTFSPSLAKMKPGGRLPYGTAVANTIPYWRQLREKCPVPLFPDCQAGWDDSPRRGVNSRMVTQRSPDQYERLMTAAKDFMAETASVPKIVFLSSWNEWTEDHVLLPDTVYGYSYLEAVRRAFRS